MNNFFEWLFDNKYGGWGIPSKKQRFCSLVIAVFYRRRARDFSALLRLKNKVAGLERENRMYLKKLDATLRIAAERELQQ